MIENITRDWTDFISVSGKKKFDPRKYESQILRFAPGVRQDDIFLKRLQWSNHLEREKETRDDYIVVFGCYQYAYVWI